MPGASPRAAHALGDLRDEAAVPVLEEIAAEHSDEYGCRRSSIEPGPDRESGRRSVLWSGSFSARSWKHLRTRSLKQCYCVVRGLPLPS